MRSDELIQRLDRALPQTQCTRCGYPDCRSYAQALAAEEAGINQCPPGGAEGVRRLAALTGRPVLPLNPTHGQEGPRHLAVIDEAWCIGCTLCLKACPVDAIAGAAKQMHVVVNEQCTGCELCVPACPVDCISLQDITPGRSGWSAWTAEQAEAARLRHDDHRARRTRDRLESEARVATAAPAAATAPTELAASPQSLPSPYADAAERKRAVIEAALARARAKR